MTRFDRQTIGLIVFVVALMCGACMAQGVAHAGDDNHVYLPLIVQEAQVDGEGGSVITPIKPVRPPHIVAIVTDPVPIVEEPPQVSIPPLRCSSETEYGCYNNQVWFPIARGR